MRRQGWVWAWVLGLGLGAAAAGVETGGRQVLDLSGPAWQMEGIRPGQGEREGFFESFGEVASSFYNWNGATVPGDVYTDLWHAGVIDDPHVGRNGMRAKWVMEREWWYRRDFGVPPAWQGRRVRLVFDGVDYAAEVWLNGRRLGRHEGMFSSFDFDVTEWLTYEDNRRANGLVVKLDPPPRSYRQVAGRKFPWHGDYWRTLTPIGIWRPVRLVATGPAYLEDVYPHSRLQDDGAATVIVDVRVAGDRAAGTTVQGRLQGANFEGPSYTARATVEAQGRATLRFEVPDAHLWWPWDLGRPNLHRVVVSLVGPGGALWDRSETRFGIREIRMVRNPGYSEEAVQYPWTPVINGRRTFYRSASWGGPPDIFYGRNSEATYRKLVTLAREANINNLRIFGWHPPEIPAFYALCDELGLTVWQDLIPLASVRLPEDDAFRAATHAEAIATLKRLRRHPSVVLLEGGEEMLYGREGLTHNARFLVELGKAIRPYSDLPYVPTSPLNWPRVGLGGPKDSAHTHKIYYSIGSVLLEEDIAQWDYAVIPEFGVTSCPNVESLRAFIPPDELWPPGPSWGYHWADLDILRALNAQVFGDERTGSLEDFVAATQIAQGTIFQWGIEHQRRRKPTSSAIAICHFITYAPDMKWGIVDYFQRPKRSYDFVRRAFQPLLVSLETERRRWRPGERFAGRLWIVNDRAEGFADCRLGATMLDARGRTMAERSLPVARIAPDSATAVGELTGAVAGTPGEGFHVTLSLEAADGRVLSANHYDLLVGDQDRARAEAARRAAAWGAIRQRFPKSDYYRYYPALRDPEHPFRTGDAPPRAAGFGDGRADRADTP